MRMPIRRLALVLATLACGCVSVQAQRESRNDRYDSRYDSRDDRRSDPDFHWSGEVARNHWVYVRNLNGAVRVEQGTGPKVEITAVKRWRRGNPEEVTINVRQSGSGRGDLVVCALWRNRDSCDEDGYRGFSMSNLWNSNDVSVEFTIRLPEGVRLDASTVNGGLTIDGATADVVARTTNGGIDARSLGGPVSAKTVNGSINVRAGAIDGGRTEYSTTNGSITVELPEKIDADLDMRTVNGRVTSDFPLTIDGTFSNKRIHGKLGNGGPSLRIATVNGSFRLRKS
jgi:DUF4097 and DUF4098 domain-containing protein YvlB